MFEKAKILQKKRVRLPYWIKSKTFQGELRHTKQILRKYGICTVCEEARCPNIGKCFLKPAATFMILGSKCTRNCSFCAVESSEPEPINYNEPEMVAQAAKEMKLRYIVITSVTRDDLSDGGAGQFAKTIRAVKRLIPDSKAEVLTPDFKGNLNNLKTVLDASPDVYNHNLETVSRLYPYVRPNANYRLSLKLIEFAKRSKTGVYTKSGLMLGLGEKLNEVKDVLKDLRNAGCDIVTIGQYLRPSKLNLPVIDYIHPEIFENLRVTALSMGFKYAASAPFVRSSMNAEEMYNN
ncbi:MAG: lipoyl synthase [Nitrospirae bacterium]|jgi:lipoyl synthase|nr:lipoyl synthase [Nitrospirota bacterium]